MSLSDFLAALYLASRFLFRRAPADAEWTVVFARGAFRRDIPKLGEGTVLVNIGGEWLRRFLRLGVPDAWLEQVICLGYREPLRQAFPLTIRMLSRMLRGKRARILFGGVDYFEVVLFAEPSFYGEGTRIEAVFHENYAIAFVENVTDALYRSIPREQRIVIENLYAYGPPASRILSNYMNVTARPMTMPRLANMQDDTRFADRLACLDDPHFARTVLLLAFPGTDYLAPIGFVATLVALAGQADRGEVRTLVKFKAPAAAKASQRHLGRLRDKVDWIFDEPIESLAWRSGFAVVFNSISLYEALLGPGIVVIPAFLDTLHDGNLLQETPESVRELCGDLQSVRFVGSLADMGKLLVSMDTAEIRRVVGAERSQRKALVSRKFFL